MYKNPVVSVVLLCTMLLIAACSDDNAQSVITLSDAYAFELPSGSVNGAAYLSIKNNTDNSIKIVSITSPIARKVEMHTYHHQEGVMKMKVMGNLEIASNDTLIFSPGKVHIMLIELTHPLVSGESFPLNIQFSNRVSLEIQVEIKHLSDNSNDHASH